ncbi:MAG: hypothetical protein ACR2P0_11365 [Acidimicrobiales bacterium]
MSAGLEERLTQAIRPDAITGSPGNWMDVAHRAHRTNQRKSVIGRAFIAGFVVALGAGVVLGFTVDGGIDTTGTAAGRQMRESWPQPADFAAARGQATADRFWIAGVLGWLPAVLVAMWAWVTAPAHLRTPRPYQRLARLASASAAAALLATAVAFLSGTWLFFTYDPLAIQAGTSLGSIVFGQASRAMLVFGLAALFITPRVSKNGRRANSAWNMLIAIVVIPFAVGLYSVPVDGLTWRAASDGPTRGLWGRLIGWRTFYDTRAFDAVELDVLSAWFSFMSITGAMAGVAWLARRIWRVTTLDAVRDRRIAKVDLVQAVLVTGMIAVPVMQLAPYWVAGAVAVRNIPIPAGLTVTGIDHAFLPGEGDAIASFELDPETRTAFDGLDPAVEASGVLNDAGYERGFSRVKVGTDLVRDRSDSLDGDVVRIGEGWPLRLEYQVVDSDGLDTARLAALVGAALLAFAAIRRRSREAQASV